MEEKIKQLVEAAQKIVVVQADNPDADSLGSALALEHILGDMGKDVYLYCGVDVPTYLRYLSGWDRVQKDLPKQFDLSIIVDASTYTLLDRLDKTGQIGWLKARPCIVLDHHATVQNPLDFAAATICDDKLSSAGEVVYQLAKKLAWPISAQAGENVMVAILGDTQGLMNDLARPSTYRTMAELTELGVSRPKLEEMRRESNKMPGIIYKYKGTLISHTELAADGAIAYVVIPQAEINEYSPLYNPGPLIQFDMMQISGVKLSIVFKKYDDGRVTAALRANSGYGVAGQLAEKMGGGGHAYAAGFKITTGKPFADIKSECLKIAIDLLDQVEKVDQND
ncbi:MAG: DHH family phosphoesterase [Candidatus Saccharimonadales bacterium]